MWIVKSRPRLRTTSTHDDVVDGRHASLVVELDVASLERSIEFYGTLGFAVAVWRPERQFAYLTRDGVDVMVQSADGPGARLRTAPLERPLGRGVCLLVPCADVDALFEAFVEAGGGPLVGIHERDYDVDVLRPTARWSQPGRRHLLNRQFVVADPDGYLLRFYTEVAP
jgi:catechol 2,3-dioxygenase-like lactoylglutathione lyase family enzyme